MTAEAAGEAVTEAAAEAAGRRDAEDAAQADTGHVSPDAALSDNLSRLQLDRLDSNAAAGRQILCGFECIAGNIELT